MPSRSIRLFAVTVALLLAAAADRVASATARCVVEGGLTYCCWTGGTCRVCDSLNCYILPGSECPQNCPS
jgi:hypothetical protein